MRQREMPELAARGTVIRAGCQWLFWPLWPVFGCQVFGATVPLLAPGECTGCTGCTTGAQGHLDRGARSSTQQYTGSTTAQTADPGPPDHTTSPCKTQSPRLMAESLWAQNPGQKLGRAKSEVAL